MAASQDEYHRATKFLKLQIVHSKRAPDGTWKLCSCRGKAGDGGTPHRKPVQRWITTLHGRCVVELSVRGTLVSVLCKSLRSVVTLHVWACVFCVRTQRDALRKTELGKVRLPRSLPMAANRTRVCRHNDHDVEHGVSGYIERTVCCKACCTGHTL